MSMFVGRVVELGALGEVAPAAAGGRVAAALVVGDPGSGKSRLLAEAAARARVSARFRVVGYEPESEVPLAAASDLLRSLAGTAADGRRLEGLILGNAGEDASPLEALAADASERGRSDGARARRAGGGAGGRGGPALTTPASSSGSTVFSPAQ